MYQLRPRVEGHHDNTNIQFSVINTKSHVPYRDHHWHPICDLNRPNEFVFNNHFGLACTSIWSCKVHLPFISSQSKINLVWDHLQQNTLKSLIPPCKHITKFSYQPAICLIFSLAFSKWISILMSLILPPHSSNRNWQRVIAYNYSYTSWHVCERSLWRPHLPWSEWKWSWNAADFQTTASCEAPLPSTCTTTMSLSSSSSSQGVKSHCTQFTPERILHGSKNYNYSILPLHFSHSSWSVCEMTIIVTTFFNVR